MKGRGRLAWLAPLLSLACTQPSSACGFHSPDDLGIQRAGLSWSFPKASYVQGAVSMAMSAGILRLSDRLQRGDLFGFHRVAAKFQALASRIDGGGTRLKAPVSIVLIGPMLWSVITPSPDGLAVRTHTDGPAPGAAVIITDVPVLAALLSGDLSSQTAEAVSLIRIYGPANMVMNTRAALRDAFPDKKRAISRSNISIPRLISKMIMICMGETK